MRDVSAALALLPRRDRLRLVIAIALQALLGVLDILGILMVGIVAAIAVASITGVLPPQISSLRDLTWPEDATPIQMILALSLIAGFLLLFRSAASFWLTRRTLQFLANRQALLAGRLATALLSQSLPEIGRRSSQEAGYALTTGAANATLTLLGQGIVIMSEGAILLVIFTGLTLVNFWVTLFAIIYFGMVGLIVNQLVAKGAQRLGGIARDADVASFALIQEAIRNFRTVHVSGIGPVLTDSFKQLRWRAASVQADLHVATQVPKYVFDVAIIVGAGALVLAQGVVSDLSYGVAIIAVYLVAASRIMPSLLRLQGAVIDWRSGIESAKSALTLASEMDLSSLTDPSEISISASLTLRRLTDGINSNHAGLGFSIVLEDVSAKYPDSNSDAIRGVSLSVSEGEATAFVGSSGAGKSTLADLVLGVMQPSRGVITVGGMSPGDVIRLHPGSLAYVPQEISSMTGTVRSNVALGLPDSIVDDDRVREVLDFVGLHDFLSTWRQGLDTPIGEGGAKLSGGQRQRLGLARALYSRPRMLVLDEVTSALDAESEAAISGALESLRGEMTLIVIAHRLSTVMNMDRIFLLDEGRLAVSGTFDEVRSLSPSFDQQAKLMGL